MSALIVEDLVVDYQGRRGLVRAVDGVSFTVAPGRTVALVGETGSGKTTAALAAIGMLPPAGIRAAGRTVVDGTDITGWPRRRLRGVHGTRVGLIPQDPTSSLDPLLTVGTQVGEALRIHGERDRAVVRAEVSHLLQRVGLTDVDRIARSYPHQLSGGQRQRVLIAGAIALRPALLVADESTSALDVTVQWRVLDLIDELREEDGSGVLFVTHDLAVAAERADEIVVLRDGRVQDAGPIRFVLGGAGAGYTRSLVENAPALRPAAFRAAPDAGLPVQVTARGVSKTFSTHGDRVRALDGVDLSVARGTTHAIVGESGSGKSTLARIVLGLEQASEGSVTVGVTRVTDLRRGDLRGYHQRVQLVHQSPFASLDPSRTILDTVAEPLKRFGIVRGRAARRAAAELLERVALGVHLHDRRPRELSGGQCQRVAIARALAPRPDTVVLDEPVSALDVSVQAQTLELIGDLQREFGLTYLFITHDLAVVRQISDTVTVLAGGRVQDSGSTEQIFTTPMSEYTRALLNAIPQVPDELTAR